MHVDFPDTGGSDSERLWSVQPGLGAAVSAFGTAIQEQSMLPVDIAEAARIRIAHINGCEPCSDTRVEDMAAYGLDESFYADADDPAKRGRYTDRQRLAIEFAERFAAGKQSFDGRFWAELQAAFSAAEIVDLAASVAKWLAIGRIYGVFGVTVACPIRLKPKAA